MKIAFIHPSSPEKESTGASYSANKIIEGLNPNHDLTVYCLDAMDDINKSYETETLLQNENSYRSSTTQLNQEIVDRKDELRQFDIIYSYPMMTVLGLGKINPDIDSKIVVTLNAYGAICPTNTLEYRESNHFCPGELSCLKCTFNQIARESSPREYPIETARKILKLRRLRKTRKYLDNIDRFHALTENVKSSYIDAGFPEDKIKVFSPILDEKFLVEHKSNFEEPYKLLHVGYLKNHKGVDILIPVIEELNRNTEKEVKLTIVGDGPMESKIQKQKEKSPIGDKIELKGRVPNEELPETYSEHDLFVYPGRWDEPFGRIFIESLAAGTPVISTPTGVTTELDVIQTVENDKEKIAAKIEENLDKEKLEELSRRGKKTVEKFKSEKIISGLEASISGLIEES